MKPNKDNKGFILKMEFTFFFLVIHLVSEPWNSKCIVCFTKNSVLLGNPSDFQMYVTSTVQCKIALPTRSIIYYTL